MRMLVVEDSITLGHVLKKYVKDMNHKVITVRSGEQALQYIETMPVDMVLMDIEMPGLDGLETTRLIRESMDHWLPIIFVSGKGEEDDFKKGIEAGGDDYLIKPISRVILQAKIKAMERILSMQKELNSLYEELEFLHRYDSLTQIYNRAAVKERADAMWKQVGRQGRYIAVLMIDVDHFKQYNDHYGHPAGDSCLQQISQAFHKTFQRSEDLYGRYGGEEFIVVLSNTDLKSVQIASEKLKSEIESLAIPHAMSKTSDYVTISVGGSVIPHSNDANLEQTIKHADSALYKAKSQGRNRVVIEEFLFRAHKNIIILNATDTVLRIFRDMLKDRCRILTADNSEDCFEIVEAINAEMVVVNSYSTQLGDAESFQKLHKKVEELEIPLIYLATEDSPPIEKGSYIESVDVNDDAALQSVVNRHFPA